MIDKPPYATGPEVRKLIEAFPNIQRGQLITHDEIEKVIRHKRDSNRYKTVTSRWRKEVENERGIVIDGRGEAQGVGFRALLDGEQVKFGVNQRKASQRRIRRWHGAVSRVDEAKLSDSELRVRQHEMMNAAALHALMIEGEAQVRLDAFKQAHALPGQSISEHAAVQ
jgi:hypothetical protein